MFRVLIISNKLDEINTIERELFKREQVADIRIACDLQTADLETASVEPCFAIVDPDIFGEKLHSKVSRNKYSFPVIVMSRNPECAVRAFELNANDFILLPVNPTRLNEAINRVINHLNQRLMVENYQLNSRSNANKQNQAETNSKKLVIKETGRIRLVEQEQIRFVRGAGNYVEIHLDDGNKILHRSTLRSIEDELDQNMFCRIHKSALIKSSLVEELRPLPKGGYKVKIDRGDHFTLSRGNKDKLPILLRNS